MLEIKLYMMSRYYHEVERMPDTKHEFVRTDLIAAMIQAAVDAEREACAFLAIARADRLSNYAVSREGGEVELRNFAAAIRARKGGAE